MTARSSLSDGPAATLWERLARGGWRGAIRRRVKARLRGVLRSSDVLISLDGDQVAERLGLHGASRSASKTTP